MDNFVNFHGNIISKEKTDLNLNGTFGAIEKLWSWIHTEIADKLSLWIKFALSGRVFVFFSGQKKLLREK